MSKATILASTTTMVLVTAALLPVGFAQQAELRGADVHLRLWWPLTCSGHLM